MNVESQLQRYARLLGASELTFQLVHRTNRNYARSLYGRPTRWASTLGAYNTLGCDVYVMPNHSGSDQRKAEDIQLIRACFADYDKGTPDSWQLVPTFVVESSPNKCQAYWVLGPLAVTTSIESVEVAVGINRSIAASTGGDPAAVDIARVLRAPGFANCKYAVRPVAHIVSESLTQYSLEELAAVWRPATRAKETLPSTATGNESDTKRYCAWLRPVIDSAPVTGWNEFFYRAAAMGCGTFGLSAYFVFEALYLAINARWGIDSYPYDELQTLVDRAAKYCRHTAPASRTYELIQE